MRNIRPVLVIVVALLGARAGSLGAQVTPVLVKDVNSTPAVFIPSAGALSGVGAELYFNGDGEFWKTDGGPAGARIVRAIRPAGASDPGPFVRIDDSRIVFPARGVEGRELWATDGTAAGTRLVRDINRKEPPGHSFPANLTLSGSTVFFTADDGVHGVELWKTDATEAGTVLVKDVVPGSFGSRPTGLTAFGAGVLFFESDGATSSLWNSDGTDAGTILLTELTPPKSTIVVRGDRAYFGGFDGTTFGYFVTDGTPAGTTRLKEVSAGSDATLGAFVYFVVFDPATGYSLWRTDGSTAGTTLATLLPDFLNSRLFAAGSFLYFNVGGGPSPGLWRTDGTAVGTVAVKNCDVSSFLVEFAGGFLFASSGQLWTSDGTPAGTIPLTSFGPAEEIQSGIATAGGLAYFTVGSLLWQTDGTVTGTHASITGTPTTNSSGPSALTGVNGLLYFTVFYPSSAGNTLYVTDGSGSGTKQLTCDGCKSSADTSGFEGKAYFGGSDPVNGRELWVTDGTNSGTALVKDIFPGAGSSVPRSFVVGGKGLFFAATGPEGEELWKTDGTRAGTILVKDIRPGPSSSRPFGLTAAGCTMYFFADDGTHGVELWKSDGNELGTALVKDIVPGTASGPAGDPLFRFGGLILFSASDGVNGFELWKSDGTEAGTAMVKDVFPGPGSSIPLSLCEMGGLVYFFAREPSGVWALWRTDGTEGGTAHVSDLSPLNLFNPHDLVAMKGRLFFAANDGVQGDELWTSDGTAKGTHILVDIQTGRTGSLPLYLVNVDGILYFAADDGIHGQELWQSDGTAAGTSLVGEVASGPGESSVGPPVASGGRLYFSAFEPSVGQELWSIPLPPVSGGFNVVIPCRVFDTRDPAGPAGGPSLRAWLPRSFPVAGICGIPADARAVVGNLTSVNGTSGGEMSLGASDQPGPRAAALPFLPGRARANNVVVKLGTTGAITVELSSPDCAAQGDAIFDVAGYFR